jgi:ribosome modulation factor
MFYDTVRDWARIYCPDILAGLKGGDELANEVPEYGPGRARDVTPSANDLRLRLGAGRTAPQRRDELDEYLNQALDQSAESLSAGGAANPSASAPGAGDTDRGGVTFDQPAQQSPAPQSDSSQPATADGGDGVVPDNAVGRDVGVTSSSPVTSEPEAAPTPESFAEQVQQAVDPIEVAKRRGRQGFRDGKRRRECPTEYRSPGRGEEALEWTAGWDQAQSEDHKSKK